MSLIRNTVITCCCALLLSAEPAAFGEETQHGRILTLRGAGRREYFNPRSTSRRIIVGRNGRPQTAPPPDALPGRGKPENLRPGGSPATPAARSVDQQLQARPLGNVWKPTTAVSSVQNYEDRVSALVAASQANPLRSLRQRDAKDLARQSSGNNQGANPPRPFLELDRRGHSDRRQQDDPFAAEPQLLQPPPQPDAVKKDVGGQPIPTAKSATTSVDVPTRPLASTSSPNLRGSQVAPGASALANTVPPLAAAATPRRRSGDESTARANVGLPGQLTLSWTQVMVVLASLALLLLLIPWNMMRWLRRAFTNLEPTIRVELADSLRITAAGHPDVARRDDEHPNHDHMRAGFREPEAAAAAKPVNAVDFGALDVPFVPTETFAESQRRLAEAQSSKEEGIIKQLIADNRSLRQELQLL